MHISDGTANRFFLPSRTSEFSEASQDLRKPVDMLNDYEQLISSQKSIKSYDETKTASLIRLHPNRIVHDQAQMHEIDAVPDMPHHIRS